jgi:hypothetical protein
MLGLMMKRSLFILLIFLAVGIGAWLVKENRALLILTNVVPGPQQEMEQQPPDWDRVTVGMETWQVKDVVGPPEKRHVEIAAEGTKKEDWTYGDRCLHFTNGVLISWEGE